MVDLMLRKDVVEAVQAGHFHIYCVSTIDEGLELFTGVKAGTLCQNSHNYVNNNSDTTKTDHGDKALQNEFEEGTVNRLVQLKLQELSNRRLQLSGSMVEQPASKL
jgi:hypothetical protein